MKQQTAVGFLFEKIKSNIDSEDGSMCMNWLYDDTLKEAKEMEKKQIIDAYKDGLKISGEGWNGEYGIRDFNLLNEAIETEKYYNEKYKKS